MSMPSSRLEVATTAGSRPAFSASSICARSCRDTEPWWARATSAGAPAEAPAWAMICAGMAGAVGARGMPSSAAAASSARSAASSLSRAHSRSASRRELANTIVDRCCLDEVEHPLLDVRPDRALGGRRRRAGTEPSGPTGPTRTLGTPSGPPPA